jgi:RNA polymerase sigma-70 factor, ECF subfamily
MTGAMTWFAGMMAGDRTDLAARLRRRDPELLELLIEQYEYRLFRYLLCLTSNRAVAEDLFQETWIRVLDRGHQYRAGSSFDAWLFSIARHLVIDLSRRKKTETLDAVTESTMTAPGASALDEVFRKEREAEVQDALARLPAIHREVLLLRFQEDLALPEIAAVIEAPLSTAKSRLYRALESLRQELEGAHA